MTVKECYQYIQNKLNKLSTNSNDNLPKFQFVEAFNACQTMWIEDRMKFNETNILRIDELQPILIPTTLLDHSKKDNHYLFPLPVDYLHYKRSYCYVPCLMTIYLKSEGNIGRFLSDNNWKPSLEWGETLATIVNNNLKVYVDDTFTINQVELVYYRTPRKINMASGYPDVNGLPTVDVDPEFVGSSLLEILNLTARMLAGDTTDQWNYQTGTDTITRHT